MDMDQPVVGAVTSQLILTCSQLPMASSHTMKSITTWPTMRQIFLPMGGSLPHHHVDAEVAVLLQRDEGAEEGASR
jgi:hypothetical protein